jgi:hypothetical protein
MRTALLVFALIGQMFLPWQATAQSSTPRSSARPSLIETLNQEAASSDPDGLLVYSHDLIQTLVPKSAGPKNAAAFTDRLTRAEFAARHGQRKLISEEEILQAFNALMKDTGAPDALRADMAAVREARTAFEGPMPAVISRKENGAYCNPGEAVFVIEMLIENVGNSSASSAHAGSQTFSGKAPVRGHLEMYDVKHSQSEVAGVWNRLFHALQI